MSKFWNKELSNIQGKIGDDCVIHSFVWIGKDVIIGNRVKIQAFAFIPKGVEIGDDCFIGPHVCFTNDKHPPSNGMEWLNTIVKRKAVICANATILPGNIIGENAMVGAGSVVTSDIPDNEVWCGNPARFLKQNEVSKHTTTI